jgi:uncharacterized protein YbjT (DUF2867 family)
MKVILFGATGMVGQGILRECLLDARVTTVLTIGRNATGQLHAKLREITLPDLFDLAPIADRLAGYDVCFFSLGVSSVGMTEEQYTHTTYDLTLSIAHTLLDLNPALIFFYISGAGTDSTEKGRSMWARVKGRTENDLLRMPFKAAYMLRPGFIAPLHGIQSKTALYRMLYKIAAPIVPLLQRTFPRYVTSTEELARSMIRLAAGHSPSRVIENREIAGV